MTAATNLCTALCTARLTLAALPLLLLSIPLAARAEASHHQGPSAGQVVAGTVTAGVESLTEAELPSWEVWLFPSLLTATRSYGDTASLVPLTGADRISSHALNAYVERRVGSSWGASVLAAFQHLAFDRSAGSDTVTSLSDVFLSVRHTDRWSWGSLSAVATVKVPGTYPESALTSAKQTDVEGKVLAAVPLASSVSAVVGAGYKLRLGGIKDEVTATAVLPVRLGERFVVTPSVTGGFPIGLGEVAKNTVTPGIGVEWRATQGMGFTAAYYRTVYGRNVVDASIFMIGIANAF